MSFLSLTLALSACVPADHGGSDIQPLSPEARSIALPEMRLFPAATGVPSTRSNSDIAQDFLDLSFRLESGREIDAFSRFATPLTVRMMGSAPPTAARDLAILLARLRNEAGIAISTTTGEDAAITIEFISRRTLQASARDAACFVAPRVSSFSQYRRAGRAMRDWADYTTRTHVAIFIPSDTSPQEVRDCMHEELAQALGPLNDLYRLPDSIFNDDNIQGVLTGFDMVILRATYAAELQPGMSKMAVAALLPGILARVNPGGQRATQSTPPTPRTYGEAIARALGPSGSPAGRQKAAREALAISQPWQDQRTGFAWMALARVSDRKDPNAAQAAFANASAIFHARALPLHAAHADVQLAIFALAAGQFDRAAAIADRAIPAATSGQNGAILAGLLMVKAAALDHLGQGDQAALLRLHSLGWARYGMASDNDVRRRLAKIDALADNAGAAGQ